MATAPIVTANAPAKTGANDPVLSSSTTTTDLGAPGTADNSKGVAEGSIPSALPLPALAATDATKLGVFPELKGVANKLPQAPATAPAEQDLNAAPAAGLPGVSNPPPVHPQNSSQIHIPAVQADGVSPSSGPNKADTQTDPAPVAVKIQDQINPNHEHRSGLPALGISMESEADNAGTGVAIMESLMKNLQKTNKVAGLDAKVLPVGQNGQTSGNILPQLPVTPVRGAENQGTDLGFAFSNGNSHPLVADQAQSLNTLDLPSLADARTRSLDRAHDMVALHTMRLVESKSDMLSVVIKPAVGTELSLELRQGPDGVKAHAQLIRGDHQFFSQHWAELQQKLEQRGIKLAPLGSEAGFFSNNNSQFNRQQPSQDDFVQQASAFAEFAVASHTGGATAKLAPTHNGWESWA